MPCMTIITYKATMVTTYTINYLALYKAKMSMHMIKVCRISNYFTVSGDVIKFHHILDINQLHFIACYQ